MTAEEVMTILRLADGAVAAGVEVTAITAASLSALCRANLRLVAMERASDFLIPVAREFLKARTDTILADMEKRA